MRIPLKHPILVHFGKINKNTGSQMGHIKKLFKTVKLMNRLKRLK